MSRGSFTFVCAFLAFTFGCFLGVIAEKIIHEHSEIETQREIEK